MVGVINAPSNGSTLEQYADGAMKVVNSSYTQPGVVQGGVLAALGGLGGNASASTSAGGGGQTVTSTASSSASGSTSASASITSDGGQTAPASTTSSGGGTSTSSSAVKPTNAAAGIAVGRWGVGAVAGGLALALW
jgi:hypothetical protein